MPPLPSEQRNRSTEPPASWQVLFRTIFDLRYHHSERRLRLEALRIAEVRLVRFPLFLRSGSFLRLGTARPAGLIQELTLRPRRVLRKTSQLWVPRWFLFDRLHRPLEVRRIAIPNRLERQAKILAERDDLVP